MARSSAPHEQASWRKMRRWLADHVQYCAFYRLGSYCSASACALVCLIAFSLSACTVGPDFEQPATPNVTGYLPEQPASLARTKSQDLKIEFGATLSATWWELFRNKRLNSLIEDALRNNADLEAAEAAVRVAQANAAALRGGFWPTVQATWNSSRQQTPTSTLQSNSSTDKAIYSLHTPQVSVAYVADVFGGLRRQAEASEAQVEAQQFQREAAAVTLTANLAVATIQQASFEGQIEATQRLIAVQTQLLEVLRRQQAAGQIALPDVLVQETAAAQAKLLLPPLQRQRDQQRHVIAVLTGRLPGQTKAETFRLESFRSPRQVPVSLPADLVRQRPDIRVAEANLRQANAQVGAAIAARFPQLTLTGNGGSTAELISRLFSSGTWFWMIAGNAMQTVFDGQTLAMKQKAAEETFVQQTAQYRSVVLTAFQNVADVLVALEADARSIVAAKEAETAADRSLEITRRQLEQGQVSLPTLLTAQQAFLQTSVARVQAEASRLANTVALFQALGGGWWSNAIPAPEVRSPHARVVKASQQ